MYSTYGRPTQYPFGYRYNGYASWPYGYGAYRTNLYAAYRPWYSYPSAYWLYRPWYTFPQSFWLYHPRYAAGLFHVPYYLNDGYYW
jgi:hypothetical protein